MTLNDVYDMVRYNLGELNPSTGRETYIRAQMNSALSLMVREGVTFGNDYGPEDAELIVMYTNYLITKRDSETGMPRMLRLALNNRIFAEKINAV